MFVTTNLKVIHTVSFSDSSFQQGKATTKFVDIKLSTNSSLKNRDYVENQMFCKCGSNPTPLSNKSLISVHFLANVKKYNERFTSTRNNKKYNIGR